MLSIIELLASSRAACFLAGKNGQIWDTLTISKIGVTLFFRFLIRRGKCGSNVKLRFHNKQRGVPPTWTVTRRAPFAFGSGNDRKVIALSVLVISVVLQCPRSSQTSWKKNEYKILFPSQDIHITVPTPPIFRPKVVVCLYVLIGRCDTA